jgi:hypothetical protein
LRNPPPVRRSASQRRTTRTVSPGVLMRQTLLSRHTLRRMRLEFLCGVLSASRLRRAGTCGRRTCGWRCPCRLEASASRIA